jgi:hypothetical protein
MAVFSWPARLAIGVAAAFAVPAGAQTFPRIEATWYIGEAEPDPVLPTHFSLGPGLSRAETIAISRILPNVLVETSGAAAYSGARPFSLPAGTQLFQLARQGRTTFCAVAPLPKGYPCLVDTDGDDRLDSFAMARSPVVAPPFLTVRAADLAPLDAPVSVKPRAREECARKITIALGYYGRRRMTRRDASFMISVMSGGDGSVSPMFPVYLDAPLPPEVNIGGVKLVNLLLNGKKLEFDVASGFPAGPFDPAFGGAGRIEWGW